MLLNEFNILSLCLLKIFTINCLKSQCVFLLKMFYKQRLRES